MEFDPRSLVADATFRFYGQDCAERFYYATLQKSEIRQLALQTTKDNRFLRWNQPRFWWYIRLFTYSVVLVPLALICIVLAYTQYLLVYWYHLKLLRILSELSGQALKRIPASKLDIQPVDHH